MNISYNWLRRYLDSDLSAEQMAVVLTDIGLEIEGFDKIESVKGGLEGVVVGEVVTCINHPDSDHLHITTVDVGSGEPLGIVCGAHNCRAGLKVMVATVGTTLYPNGGDEAMKIKRSKIRGVESLGMLCAEDELGIGTDHAGIMELPADAPVGKSAKEYLDIKDDYLFGIGLTPNRIDAASHYGVARDLYAYLRAHGQRATLSLPSIEGFGRDCEGLSIEVEVQNSTAAPRYAGVTIEGVTIAPSPEWLQSSLRAVGINPKNNVVDVTNFVLHELCQPLHSFDADRIEGGRVVVRTCAEGTKFTTLDGVERTLSADDLMICDIVEPMCIAGVLGGAKSGVTDHTTNVFLESAYFNPVWVRKSAKRHGLNTDASFRFERGIDPNITLFALKRAALLIRELAGGRISSEVIDICPVKAQPFRVELSFDRVDSLIGKCIGQQTVRDILEALEMKIIAEKEGGVVVEVPPYRVDVQREADVIEDILRIYGYNNVEIPTAVKSTLSYEPKPNRDKVVNVVSDLLSANGFTEIMSNSLTKAAYYDELKSFPKEHCVRIINPLSVDLNVMRQTLLFNALEAVQLNTNHRNADLRLYEFGNCYFYDPERAAQGGLAPYSEGQRLSMTVTGQSAPNWNAQSEPLGFFALKAAAEKVLARLGQPLDSLQSEQAESDLFDQAVSYSVNGKELFTIGAVSSALRRTFDLKAPVFYLELDFDRLLKALRKHKVAASELPRFPEVRRDLALLVDEQITFEALRSIALQTERKLLKSVGLFDVYMGDKLPAGKKSYAVSFVLQDQQQTMTDQAIDRVMQNLIRAFEQKAGATIR